MKNRNQPQTIKIALQKLWRRSLQKKKKITSKGISKFACNAVAFVEVEREQMEIYREKQVNGLFEGERKAEERTLEEELRERKGERLELRDLISYVTKRWKDWTDWLIN